MSEMNKRDVVVISMARTPIGNYMGALSSVPAVELGIIAAKEVIKRAGIKPEIIDEVVTGCVVKTGLKANPARQIQLGVGIPVQAGAVTVEQQCASSMRALEIGGQQIQLGKTDVCLVTGIESMSNIPYLDTKGRKGYRMGPVQLEDGLLYDALHDAFDGKHVAHTAERVAERYHITREEADRHAMLSNDRALAAIEAGKFKEEIVPVEVKNKKKTFIVDTDEHPRKSTMESLGKLKPVFKEGGVVTAGNAAGLNDAASAMIIMSAEKAEELGLKPLARILSSATVGVDPEVMGIGPIYSVPKAVELAGLKMEDIEYFEINEAFATQLLACQRVLGIDIENLNANGSGISLGHPVGATGLRMVMATISELRRRGQRYGCGSLCVGGGPSMATIVEVF